MSSPKSRTASHRNHSDRNQKYEQRFLLRIRASIFSCVQHSYASTRISLSKRYIFLHLFDVPVISIGNLTMGGTGKTPMVQYLARLLQKNGYQPAIISRGYGGATKERINVVSDGENVLLDASYVGDEPRMLAEALPGVFVLTGIVRRLP
ncbi:MAG: hypothetical protein D3924_15065, partial [Candidatus Electrothrix sp. AR4]|nr:hypothetical protein [Candidatus Electrothrix sp. AR4]